METRKQTLLKCAHCLFVAKDARRLSGHEKQHEYKGLYTCEVCTYSHDTQKVIESHTRCHHRGVVPLNSPTKTSAPDAMVSTSGISGDTSMTKSGELNSSGGQLDSDMPSSAKKEPLQESAEPVTTPKKPAGQKPNSEAFDDKIKKNSESKSEAGQKVEEAAQSEDGHQKEKSEMSRRPEAQEGKHADHHEVENSQEPANSSSSGKKNDNKDPAKADDGKVTANCSRKEDGANLEDVQIGAAPKSSDATADNAEPRVDTSKNTCPSSEAQVKDKERTSDAKGSADVEQTADGHDCAKNTVVECALGVTTSAGSAEHSDTREREVNLSGVDTETDVDACDIDSPAAPSLELNQMSVDDVKAEIAKQERTCIPDPPDDVSESDPSALELLNAIASITEDSERGSEDNYPNSPNILPSLVNPDSQDGNIFDSIMNDISSLNELAAAGSEENEADAVEKIAEGGKENEKDEKKDAQNEDQDKKGKTASAPGSDVDKQNRKDVKDIPDEVVEQESESMIESVVCLAAKESREREEKEKRENEEKERLEKEERERKARDEKARKENEAKARKQEEEKRRQEAEEKEKREQEEKDRRETEEKKEIEKEEKEKRQRETNELDERRETRPVRRVSLRQAQRAQSETSQKEDTGDTSKPDLRGKKTTSEKDEKKIESAKKLNESDSKSSASGLANKQTTDRKKATSGTTNEPAVVDNDTVAEKSSEKIEPEKHIVEDRQADAVQEARSGSGEACSASEIDHPMKDEEMPVLEIRDEVTNKLRYKCSFCPQVVNHSKHHLFRHQRCHFRKNLLTCDMCTYGTNSQLHFREHQVLHKKSAAAQPGKCETRSAESAAKSEQDVDVSNKPTRARRSDRLSLDSPRAKLQLPSEATRSTRARSSEERQRTLSLGAAVDETPVQENTDEVAQSEKNVPGREDRKNEENEDRGVVGVFNQTAGDKHPTERVSNVAEMCNNQEIKSHRRSHERKVNEEKHLDSVVNDKPPENTVTGESFVGSSAPSRICRKRKSSARQRSPGRHSPRSPGRSPAAKVLTIDKKETTGAGVEELTEAEASLDDRPEDVATRSPRSRRGRRISSRAVEAELENNSAIEKVETEEEGATPPPAKKSRVKSTESHEAATETEREEKDARKNEEKGEAKQVDEVESDAASQAMSQDDEDDMDDDEFDDEENDDISQHIDVTSGEYKEEDVTKCKLCPFTVLVKDEKSQNNMKRHEQCHIRKSKYSCKHCSYSSGRLLLIKKHLEVLHEDPSGLVIQKPTSTVKFTGKKIKMSFSFVKKNAFFKPLGLASKKALALEQEDRLEREARAPAHQTRSSRRSSPRAKAKCPCCVSDDERGNHECQLARDSKDTRTDKIDETTARKDDNDVYDIDNEKESDNLLLPGEKESDPQFLFDNQGNKTAVKCSHCPYELPWNHGVTARMRSHQACHFRTNQFGCNICGWNARNIIVAKKHMELHPDAKPSDLLKRWGKQFKSKGGDSFEGIIKNLTQKARIIKANTGKYNSSTVGALLQRKKEQRNMFKPIKKTIKEILNLKDDDVGCAEGHTAGTSGRTVRALLDQSDTSTDSLVTSDQAKQTTEGRDGAAAAAATTPSPRMRCKFCPFTLRSGGAGSTATLRNHEKCHFRRGSFSCKACNYATNVRENWAKHVKCHGWSEEEGLCNVVLPGDRPTPSPLSSTPPLPPVPSPQEDKRQTANSTVETLKCEKCPFEIPLHYRSATLNMERHNACHSATDKYRCDECTFSVGEQLVLEKHKRYHQSWFLKALPQQWKLNLQIHHQGEVDLQPAVEPTSSVSGNPAEYIEVTKFKNPDGSINVEEYMKGAPILYVRHADNSHAVRCHFCPFQIPLNKNATYGLYERQIRKHEICHFSAGRSRKKNCTRCSFSTRSFDSFKAHCKVHSPENERKMAAGVLLLARPEKSDVAEGVRDPDLPEDDRREMEVIHMILSGEINKPGSNCCPFCPFFVAPFPDQAAVVKSHAQHHCNTTRGKFKCPKCKFAVTTQKLFLAHIKLHPELQVVETGSGKTAMLETEDGSPSIGEPINGAGGLETKKSFSRGRPPILQCHACDFTTSLGNLMFRHVQSHPLDQQKYSTTAVGLAGATLHYCGQCSYVTSVSAEMRPHMNACTGKVRLTPETFAHYQTKPGTEEEMMDAEFADELGPPTPPVASAPSMFVKPDAGPVDESLIWQCQHCDYKTFREYQLQCHVHHHSPSAKGKFKCDKCNYRAKREKDYDVHLSSHHGGGGGVVSLLNHLPGGQQGQYLAPNVAVGSTPTVTPSPIKEQATVPQDGGSSLLRPAPSPALRTALPPFLRGLGATFDCELCEFSSTSEFHYKKHMLGHTDNSPNRRYRCSICGYGALKTIRLHQHMRVMHKSLRGVALTTRVETRPAPALRSFPPPGGVPGDVAVGGRDAASRMHLLDLRQESSKRGSAVEGAILQVETHRSDVQVTSTNQHVLVVGNCTRYRCSKCDFVTDKKRLFKTHWYGHTCSKTARPRQCPTCGYRTDTKYRLDFHMSKHHKVPGKARDETRQLAELHALLPSGGGRVSPGGSRGPAAGRISPRRGSSPSRAGRASRPVRGSSAPWPRPPDYFCALCPFHDTSREAYASHVKGHNRSRVEDFRCLYCTFSAKTVESLKVHIKLHFTIAHQDAVLAQIQDLLEKRAAECRDENSTQPEAQSEATNGQATENTVEGKNSQEQNETKDPTESKTGGKPNGAASDEGIETNVATTETGEQSVSNGLDANMDEQDKMCPYCDVSIHKEVYSSHVARHTQGFAYLTVQVH